MRPRPWSIAAPEPELEKDLAKELALVPLAARVLVNRGARCPDSARRFLQGEELGPADDLPGMDASVARLFTAIEQSERIVVYGDYDVDGLSGGCLLVRLLRLLGGDVELRVPDRLREGYGLSSTGMEWLRERPPAVLVTVDHGVSAYEQVAELRELGVDVVVTDHHQVPGRLPPATTLLHPALWDGREEIRWLSGSGVAFKLACALFQGLPVERRRQRRIRECLRDTLTLAALGTVADLVPLQGENRTLVRKGLARLAESSMPALVALREILGARARRPEPEDVSFRLAPLLNAASRMGRVALAYELLLTDSPSEARRITRDLEDLNQQRRELEARVFDVAWKRAAERGEREAVLVLADPAFHPGVMGIVASRLVEKLGRPTVLIAADPSAGRGKGSGRSVPAFDLARALRRADSVLLSHGGHAAAAGLEMELAQLEPLRSILNEAWTDLAGDAPEAPLAVDAEALLAQVDARLVQDLSRMAPFGEGNPEPVFAARRVQMAAPPRCVGGGGEHLLLKLSAPGAPLSAIAFRQGNRLHEAEGDELAVAFTPRFSTFRGGATVELQLKDLRSNRTEQGETRAAGR